MLATHVIFTAYGFWLPNDPRGSWSDFVGAWDLYVFGRATKTNVTRSVAHQPHDSTRRIATKEFLKHPPVTFTGAQARAIGRGFANCFGKSRVQAFGCAILPDHCHLIVSAGVMHAEQLVTQLKGAATRELLAENLHPFQSFSRDAPAERVSPRRPPKCFARGQWKVYLNTRADVLRAIKYVENNPLKLGLRRQHWSCVSPYS